MFSYTETGFIKAQKFLIKTENWVFGNISFKDDGDWIISLANHIYG